MNDPPRFSVLKDDRHGDKGDDHGHDDDHVRDLHGDDGDVRNRFRFLQHDGDDSPAEGPLHFQIQAPVPDIYRAGNSSGSFLLGFHLHVRKRYPEPADGH